MEGDVASAAFDLADERPVQAGAFSEDLAVAELLPAGAEAFPDRRVRVTFCLLEARTVRRIRAGREPDRTGACSPRTARRGSTSSHWPAATTGGSPKAKERESATFVAHIRYASTGGLDPHNTHPFEQRGRLFAHNGVTGDLPTLEGELGDSRDLVRGDSDSELFFTVVTKHTDGHGGDVGAGLAQWRGGCPTPCP